MESKAFLPVVSRESTAGIASNVLPRVSLHRRRHVAKMINFLWTSSLALEWSIHYH
jgi:hypothetical protein